MILFFKRFVKKLIAIQPFLSFARKERFVFLFHDISLPSNSHHSEQYSTQPEHFNRILNFMNSKFQLTDIDTITSGSLSGTSEKPLAAICFDDGFYSVYQKAYPLFLEKKIPFALFINKRAVCENRLWFTDLVTNKNDGTYWERLYNTIIDKNKISLNELKQTVLWEILHYVKEDCLKKIYANNLSLFAPQPKIFCDTNDIKEMCSSGLASIHSHSVNHYMLSTCFSELSFKEIEENNIFVESITGKKDIHFAIPFGKKEHYNERVIRQCRNIGYRYLYTTNPNSFLMRGMYKQVNIIPRISIINQSIEELCFMINMNIIKKKNL